MKLVTQTVTSGILAVVASILASWLLRRDIFLVEQPGTTSRGEHQPDAVVVVVPIIIGNTIRSPTIIPHARRLPVLGRRAAKHR
jgi:hypothetical protein